MNLNCTWRDMMREAAQRLAASGVENAPRDARLLLAHALGIEPVDVIVREMDAVDPGALTTYEAAIQRRIRGEPVSRIRGWREFYGRKFKVTPDVLDPRPETELLVEQGLKRLPPKETGKSGRVLDLGTGSGCILLSVLAERPDASGVGVDISPDALEVAKINALALGIGDRAKFIMGNWGEEWSAQRTIWSSGPNRATNAPEGAPPDLLLSGEGAPFDLVLSNPPYVAAADLALLPTDVRAYDPGIALTDGSDGLGAYRAILGVASRLMKPGAWIGLEFGQGQEDAVRALLENAGLTGLAVFPDLAGIPRAAFGRRPD